ncbi:MAG TPA: 30S ribosome-binding factor RbfA [Thermomicrobiales bacterium]|nr:30S ribosome-binding factor RbfA [Thermomicrobiales bacterium]
MSARRREQVGSILREELSGILQREMKDPRLGFVSILRVDITPDMSFARVYVSVYGSQEEQQKTMEALEHASGFIRRQLAPRLTLRTIPRLRFILDRSMEHAENISRILAEIEDEEKS